MDRNHKSVERLEETFTSSQTTVTADCQKRTASENWQLLRKLSNQMALKTNPSSATSLPELKEPSSRERAVTHWRRLCKGINEQQQGAQGKEVAVDEGKKKPQKPNDLGSEQFPITSPGSVSRKLVLDLILESFTLPPHQLCVVREKAPRFAQGFRVDLVELEVPQNRPVMQVEPNPPQHLRSDLIGVHVSAPTSSFSETGRLDKFPIKRRSRTGQVASGTKGTTTATKGKKSTSNSTSSGSSGSQFPNLRQRQQELHRYRVLVEQQRLYLLELKIAREREEALHSTILFQKKLQIKECKIKAHDDNDCSNV